MTSEEAQDAYRQAWTGWCLATKPEVKRMFEGRMDKLQPLVCERPGPVWDAFIDTLPGFREFWDGWYVNTMESFMEKFEENS